MQERFPPEVGAKPPGGLQWREWEEVYERPKNQDRLKVLVPQHPKDD